MLNRVAESSGDAMNEGTAATVEPGARVRPRPETFDHYAPYLRAMVVHLKDVDPKFSYRYFSRWAGFSSPNFLKLVADGQRNLTPASIPKFARGLSLSERERESFETLVLMSLARTDEERNFLSQ